MAKSLLLGLLLLTSPVPSHSYNWDYDITQENRYSEKETKCMVEAIYYEARNTSTDDMFRVGHVILNRTRSPEWPDTICGVVYAKHKTKRGKKYDFSYLEFVKNPRPRNKDALSTVEIAAQLLLNHDGAVPDDTGGAVAYHDHSIKTRGWFRKLNHTLTTDSFKFFRLKGE